jgi:hypothetical protein
VRIEDADSASPAPEMLKTVVHGNQNYAGIYGAVIRTGQVVTDRLFSFVPQPRKWNAGDLLRPRMRLVVDAEQMLHRKLRVALSRREALVTKHLLDGAQVGAFFQHMCAKCVPESVRVNIRRQAFSDGNLLDNSAHAARG